MGLLLAPLTAWGQVQVEMIDAAVHSGALQGIADGKVVLKVDKEARQLPLGDVATLRLGSAADAMASPGQCMLLGACGEQLPVAALTLADGKAQFRSKALGDVSADMLKLRGAYMPPKDATPADLAAAVAAMKLPEIGRASCRERV